MIDAAAVTDWRKGHRARGLTEKSACRRLRQLARHVPADRAVVECGSYQGRATGWLLLGAQEGHGAHVWAVDPWETHTDYVQRWPQFDAHAAFLARMDRIGATARELTVVKNFAETAGRGWSGPPVGLLWHDAGHHADEVEADLRAWLPHLADDATVVLHDIVDPRFSVVEGARRVLGAPGWDWPGETQLWRKHPGKRGILIVRRRP